MKHPEPTCGDLTDRDRQILAFERQWWKYPGSKETVVRERFGLPPTRYYQVLNALIDHPAALAADPMLVTRLHRARAGRRRERAETVFGAQPR